MKCRTIPKTSFLILIEGITRVVIIFIDGGWKHFKDFKLKGVTMINWAIFHSRIMDKLGIIERLMIRNKLLVFNVVVAVWPINYKSLTLSEINLSKLLHGSGLNVSLELTSFI